MVTIKGSLVLYIILHAYIIFDMNVTGFVHLKIIDVLEVYKHNVQVINNWVLFLKSVKDNHKNITNFYLRKLSKPWNNSMILHNFDYTGH